MAAHGNGVGASRSVVRTKVPGYRSNTNAKLAELHCEGLPQGEIPRQNKRLTPNKPETP